VAEPRRITLRQVLESIGGPYAPIECAWNEEYWKKCGYFTSCVFREVFAGIYKDVSRRLEELDFQKLINMYDARVKKGKRCPHEGR
jgi:DNA-binding IscR family transcriptional regulator